MQHQVQAQIFLLVSLQEIRDRLNRRNVTPNGGYHLLTAIMTSLAGVLSNLDVAVDKDGKAKQWAPFNFFHSPSFMIECLAGSEGCGDGGLGTDGVESMWIFFSFASEVYVFLGIVSNG